MSTRNRPGRRGTAADRAARAAPVHVERVTDSVAAIARDLVALPLEYPDTVSDVAALIAGDPRNHDHVRAVVAAIVGDALADPFRETTANRWRALLPSWLRRQVIGATVRRLLDAEVLVATGRYAHCTDTAGRNRNKLQPIYALNLHAAALRVEDQAAATAS